MINVSESGQQENNQLDENQQNTKLNDFNNLMEKREQEILI